LCSLAETPAVRGFGFFTRVNEIAPGIRVM
jgi:hypothetical protein